jgi:uncharacterized protein
VRVDVKRVLNLRESLRTSVFLFGPRQVGKTWLLKHLLPQATYIDLLDGRERIRYTKHTNILMREVEAIGTGKGTIVIDEVQKAPGLLDEVQRVIYQYPEIHFVLTGSSARKLKRNQANLLGGRAVTLTLFPFSYTEVSTYFSLADFLQFGGLPAVFLAHEPDTKKNILESYVQTYLKEEIYDESLTRNLPAFTNFLDLAGFENGNIINYSTIAREVGVSSRLIKDYFSILEDTLLGFFLKPFHASHRKKMIRHPKFYFVDMGIVFAIKKMLTVDLIEGTPLYGETFEHFIILEIMKAIAYRREEIDVSFFRTSDGVEVDIILEKHGKIIPIEIKSSAEPRKISGMRSFLKDHTVERAYCVCQTPRAYVENNVRFLPWQDFIEKMYAGIFA